MCLAFSFKLNSGLWSPVLFCSIDGTYSEGLGRRCNDEVKTPNTVMKKIVADRVALCLFALKDIKIGEELRYDYGPDDGSMYWRKPGYKSLSEQSQNKVVDPVDAGGPTATAAEREHATLLDQSQNTVADAGGAGRSIATAAETEQSQNMVADALGGMNR